MSQKKPATAERRVSRRTLLIGAASLPLAGGALFVGARERGPSSTPGLSTSTPSAGGQTYDFPPTPADVLRLRAAPDTSQLLPTDPPSLTNVWAYEGSTPGPEVRLAAGDRVRVRLENALPQSTAVHWHGISIINEMDGVPGLTQATVAPGEAFDYDFVAPHPGTYWYHTHDRSWEQNARGLHGPLIVEEPEPYEVDREFTLLVDDWRLDDDGVFDEESLGAASEWSHDGRMGDVVTVNGKVHPELEVKAGERVRFRIINAANARILGIDFGDLPATLIALDGHPTAPRPVEGYVLVAPAQRADVVVDMVGDPGSTREVQLLVQNGSTPGISLIHGAAAPVRTSFPEVAALPERARQGQLDLTDPVRVELVMEGGAMGGMREASLGGQMMDTRELANEGRFWAFNGIAGDLDEPLATLSLGVTAVVTIRNETAFPHAMHLHGQHFKVLARDGIPDVTQDWRDTELMAGGESIEVAFVADNPGKWLLHCHMLEHAAAGMVTWLAVA